MAENNIIDFLTEDIKINSEALRAFETPNIDTDQESKKLREIQAIILRDRINELNRILAVIKRLSNL